MNDYELYEIEDFLKDEFFFEWVLVPEERHVEFWTAWLSDHPYRSDKVERARQILLSLKIEPTGVAFSADSLSALLSGMDERARKHSKLIVERKLWKGLFVRRRKWLGVAAILVVIIGLS